MLNYLNRNQAIDSASLTYEVTGGEAESIAAAAPHYSLTLSIATIQSAEFKALARALNRRIRVPNISHFLPTAGRYVNPLQDISATLCLILMIILEYSRKHY